MSKGSKQRPGTGYAENFVRIFTPSTPPLTCPVCGEDACICERTEDGPGQDEASKEVKTHYERRRFDRSGI